jgi:hypothetical protein
MRGRSKQTSRNYVMDKDANVMKGEMLKSFHKF